MWKEWSQRRPRQQPTIHSASNSFYLGHLLVHCGGEVGAGLRAGVSEGWRRGRRRYQQCPEVAQVKCPPPASVSPKLRDKGVFRSKHMG